MEVERLADEKTSEQGVLGVGVGSDSAGSGLSESSMLRALGLEVRDAAEVESRVVDTCDAKLHQLELAKFGSRIAASSPSSPSSLSEGDEAIEAMSSVTSGKNKLADELPESSSGRWGHLSTQTIAFDLEDGKGTEAGENALSL